MDGDEITVPVVSCIRYSKSIHATRPPNPCIKFLLILIINWLTRRNGRKLSDYSLQWVVIYVDTFWAMSVTNASLLGIRGASQEAASFQTPLSPMRKHKLLPSGIYWYNHCGYIAWSLLHVWLTLLVFWLKLHRFILASFVMHDPPFTIWLAHPSWLVAANINIFLCATMCDTNSSLKNTIGSREDRCHPWR